MRLRHNYLLVVIKVLEMFLKTVLSVEDKMGIKEIISSLKEMAKYSIRYIINREREKEIMSICDEVSNKVQEYKRMNDNSMILELENLKGKLWRWRIFLAHTRGFLTPNW